MGNTLSSTVKLVCWNGVDFSLMIYFVPVSGKTQFQFLTWDWVETIYRFFRNEAITMITLINIL